MKAVIKFKLALDQAAIALELRRGAKVIRTEYVITDKSVYMWVEEPLSIEIPKETRRFRVVRSGQPVPLQYAHCGSALDTFTPEAYHVYEVIEAVGQAGDRPSVAA